MVRDNKALLSYNWNCARWVVGRKEHLAVNYKVLFVASAAWVLIPQRLDPIAHAFCSFTIVTMPTAKEMFRLISGFVWYQWDFVFGTMLLCSKWGLFFGCGGPASVHKKPSLKPWYRFLVMPLLCFLILASVLHLWTWCSYFFRRIINRRNESFLGAVTRRWRNKSDVRHSRMPPESLVLTLNIFFTLGFGALVIDACVDWGMHRPRSDSANGGLALSTVSIIFTWFTFSWGKWLLEEQERTRKKRENQQGWIPLNDIRRRYSS